MSTRTKARIGITLGDPAGTGPEIVGRALRSGRLPGAEFIVIGDRSAATRGKPTRQSAQAAFDALEEAITRTRRDELDGVVTGPIHKARMYEIGFQFPGQTEFFAARAGVQNFAMLLTGGSLTVALVTTHIPLQRVPEALRTEEIVRVGRLLQVFVRRRNPGELRIAVAGLNPHAGESGALGREEIEIIAPAVAELNHGEDIFSGPHSPDTIFH